MSNLKFGLNDLALMIEKIVRDSIYEEVTDSIEKAVNEAAENARLNAKARVGAIAARVFSQINFMHNQNELIIKVDTKDLNKI